MIRQWVKVIFVALLVLLQTACPKFVAKQQNDGKVHPAGEPGSSSSGTG